MVAERESPELGNLGPVIPAPLAIAWAACAAVSLCVLVTEHCVRSVNTQSA